MVPCLLSKMLQVGHQGLPGRVQSREQRKRSKRGQGQRRGRAGKNSEDSKVASKRQRLEQSEKAFGRRARGRGV